LYRKDMEMLV